MFRWLPRLARSALPLAGWLSIAVAATPSGIEIENTATLSYLDSASGVTIAIASNRSRITVGAAPVTGAALPEPALRFVQPALSIRRDGVPPRHAVDADFVDAGFYATDPQGGFGPAHDVRVDGVYVEYQGAPGPRPVLTFDGRRHVLVQVSSQEAGDSIGLWLREGAAGSHVYRSVVPLHLVASPTDSTVCPVEAAALGALSTEPLEPMLGCELSAVFGERLSVSYGDDLQDVALTDPAGRVFDATTGEPVAGASVSVLAGKTTVQHPVTGEPVEYLSGVDGRYVLPRLQPGSDYALSITAPAGYRFPSVVQPGALAGNTSNVSDASYGVDGPAGSSGGQFAVVEGEATPVIDVPLDPASARLDARLTLDKRIDRPVVELGESVDYALTITNQADEPLDGLVIDDRPPDGFRYVDGSSRVDGVASDDPVEQDGRLLFSLGELKVGAARTIDYALQAGAGALDSDGVNLARASAIASDGTVLASAPSRASVRLVRTGAFSDRALMFGKVYVDATCDGIQNRAEWPVPGVRLWLENGRFVVSDEDGQFSMTGLAPGNHVLKLDATTLPDGLSLQPLDTAFAADPGSRFVDLAEGDFHRADFATACPTGDVAAVFDELRDRREALADDWVLDAANRFDAEGRRPTLAASGRAGADGDLGRSAAPQTTGSPDDVARDTSLDTVAGARTADAADAEPAVPRRLLAMGDPELLAADITAAQAAEGIFLWPPDEVSDDGRFMTVLRAGVEPVLYVNDVAIPDTRIGERIENLREQAQIVAWYGVHLAAGNNRVEVRGTDAFGNARVLAGADFKRPSSATRLVLRTPSDELAADGGRSVMPIDILLTDDDDVPASGVAFVTLETTRGAFAGKDLQPGVPGFQVRLENGRGKVRLASSERAGRLRVTARTHRLAASLSLVQLTAARPLIVSGLAQAGIDDGGETDSRIALFLKGGVRGDAELTLAYDTDKPSDTELLDGLPRDAAYPLTGDASLSGFEAQSRSKLYARLERDRHSLMWGDYLTDGEAELDGLARVQRTLTGANAVLDSGKTRLRAFAAQQSDARITESIPGNGTAMLYTLASAPIVANSDVIERVTTSRENPGLQLSAQRLQPGIDYRLDPVTGQLRFSDVVPSVDGDLNPVSIRASYDTTGDGDEHLIAGARLSHRFGEQTVIGASITEDRHPETGFTLAGVQGRHALGNTALTASTALMRHDDGREGSASRIGLEHAWGGRADVMTTFSWARAGSAFDNPGSGVAAGRGEWRLQHRQAFGRFTRLILDAIGSRSLLDGSRYRSAGFLLERDLGAYSVRVGGRRIDSEGLGQSLGFTTALVGLERRFTLGERPASIGIELERSLADADRHRIALEARIGVSEHVTGYARYERERGLATRTLLGLAGNSEQLVVGLESDWLPNTELFSEYRLRGAFNGRAMEAVSGVRGRYTVRPGLDVTPSLEVIRALGGTARDAIAVSVGASDTRDPHRRLAGQAEWRRSGDDDYLGLRASLAQRLNQDWSALAREEITWQRPDTGEHTLRQRLGVGLARRPKEDNRHHLLLLAEWKRDRTPETRGDIDRLVFSTDHNRQIGADLVVSGRLATKWQQRDIDRSPTWQRASLAGLRATLDIKRRWELEVGAGVLATGEGRGAGLDDLAWSAGVGASYVVAKNLRLSARWNAHGFEDADLDERGVNRRGARLGIDLKFDEESFRWLER